MKAPLKVLICTIIISIALVSVVFYRYDILSGIKRTSQTTEQTQTIEASQPKDSTPNAKISEVSALKSSPASTKTSIASIENGKKLYEEKTCALCHGASGKADTPTGQAMKATNLTLGKFQHNTENLEATAYIVKVIENGVPGTAMASFKSQIPIEQDRKDLAEYVRSLGKK